ncbi:helix-turn-helix domain-containing protein [Streptomyces sp. NPDC056704]|uniref:helix-turn-helix domain-containing protein n=1 Tax=Streptomyces TaxID=1883 RepID=UPI0036BA1DF5
MGAGSFHAAGVRLAVWDHLACAEGASNKDVAAQLGSTPHAVGRWRARFVQYRIAGLGDLSALCTAGIGPRSSRSS